VEFPPLFAKAMTLSAEDNSVLSRGTRQWVDEHNGPIKGLEDLDNEEFFPPLERLYDFRLFEAISDMMPPDMKIIGGFAGGPFEHGSYLLGLESYLMGIFQNKALFDKLHEKLKEVFVAITRKLVKIENLGIFRIGDDLGFRQATMISPEHLREYIFPIYTEVVSLSHAEGKPFILHSCGNLEQVMDDLIDTCKIDAKHSNEDVIAPFEDMKERWGGRIALLGGLDVDFLARQSPDRIKEKVKYLIDKCAGGGFALGSGNTISNYVPVENYLAMIEAAGEASH
jgi:uroporphyrinogen decarboxylase